VRDTEYAYAVASVKVLENKMLGTQDLDALLGAESYDAAKKLLSDRGYQGAAEKPLSETLKSEMERAWNAVREVCPADAPLEDPIPENTTANATPNNANTIP
jgi:vacuolar-type H+-ATPase subunit C/Vma6